MGATWLTKEGIFNFWEEICSREELGSKSCGWKNLKCLLIIYSKHKNAQKVGVDGIFCRRLRKEKLC